MEGPSLRIACEEFKPFLKTTIKKASGSAKLPFKQLTGNRILKVDSWGKHLLISFSEIHLRIHFLMFGSYRIDNPRENRVPKLKLDYGNHQLYFYSCAIKEVGKDDLKLYDHSTDLMSAEWNAKEVYSRLGQVQNAMVCDVLMDQDIFSGLGNIMKNEILFKLKMHPETRLGDLSPRAQKSMIQASHEYAWQFYEWKKKNILKRNWQIMRKKICPRDQTRVTKKPTGKLKRISHFCKKCQIK